jgi:hypothetical protein
MDSLVTTALFARSSASRKKCPIRILSKDEVEKTLGKETREQMQQLYEIYKKRFDLGGAAWYMTVTADLATKMWEKFEILREGGTKETLLWFVTNGQGTCFLI